MGQSLLPGAGLAAFLWTEPGLNPATGISSCGQGGASGRMHTALSVGSLRSLLGWGRLAGVTCPLPRAHSEPVSPHRGVMRTGTPWALCVISGLLPWAFWGTGAPGPSPPSRRAGCMTQKGAPHSAGLSQLSTTGHLAVAKAAGTCLADTR